MSEAASVKPDRSLGESARASLKYAAGSMFLRALLQFATMLVLVRLLQPADYGTAALAQSIVGIFSVVSFGTFVSHALQARNPADIDWQAHFTAGVVGNSALAVLTLGLAWILSFTGRYGAAAPPLAVLSLVFIVGVPATLRQGMLQVAHDWRRFRLLAFYGTLLSCLTGVVIALLGGGVWALVVQPVVVGVPAALDLILVAKWRQPLAWSWARYRATAGFGATRVAAGLLENGRKTVEQLVLAGTYQFATLGIFTRSVGLATFTAGRLGTMAVESLYPIITRAERRSAQFRRYAALVMRGVAWATIPSAVLLALTASDVVSLLYGPKWSGVIPLVPFAAIAVGFGAMAMAANTLLLAHNEIRACLALDVASAIFGVVLALWLLPVGMEIYLAALVAHGVILLSLAVGLLVWRGGVDRAHVVSAFLPAVVAVAAAVGAIFAARFTIGSSTVMPVRLCCESTLFGIVYLAVLRLAFERPLRELVEVAPAGNRLGAVLAFTPRMV